MLPFLKPQCHGHWPPQSRDRWSRRRRHGFTLLEFEVALLILGIAASGLFPLVSVYQRTLQSLEQRWNPVMADWYRLSHAPPADRSESLRQITSSPPNNQWYQVPSTKEWVHQWYLEPAENKWARKLGQSAAVSSSDHAWPPASAPTSLPTITVHPSDPAPGYGEVGVWNEHQHATPAGSEEASHSATWTFTIATAGWYRLQATWNASVTLASPATYTLTFGPSSPHDVNINQQVSPDIPPGSDPADEGRPWHTLATEYVPANATVTVVLHPSASGAVLADDMRLVPCTVQVPSLLWSPAGDAVEIKASVEIKP